MSLKRVLAVFMVVALAAGCSDPVTPPAEDVGPGQDKKVEKPDLKNGLPDGYLLYECTEPGKSCNAHDPCAINPICGKDKKCYPQSVMSCDDGLDCTMDTCAGMGVCKNIPKSGYCKLGVKVFGAITCKTLKRDAGTPPATDAGTDSGVQKTIVCCFKDTDRNPNDICLTCSPTESDGGAGNNTSWSPANGGYCDDGNACTKNDYCQNGSCKGTNYASQCSDSLSCTLDRCDGKGGCLGNQLKTDYCLINGTCYKDKSNHPAGSCYTCDVSKTQSAWTAINDTCMIGGKCYKKGDLDQVTKCGQCDPAKSTTAWTPLSNVCLIGSTCYKPGDLDPVTKCGKCDPATDPKGWTPLKNVCLMGGKCYQPKDKHSGGCAECDPTVSATKWTVTGNFCLISDVCKNPNDKDATGCSTCQPAKDKYGWTPLTDLCLISGKCHKKGDKDTTGCGYCDPAKNAKGWTPLSSVCLIAGKCYSPGAKHSTGCGSCDPAKNAKGWTPVAGSTIVHYTFEKTMDGFSATSASSGVGWARDTKRTTSAPGALYYGNPVSHTYASGSSANNGTATSPKITLPASKKASVSFQIYAEVEGSTTYDQISVRVKGSTTTLWKKTPKFLLGTWNEVVLDLSAHAGKTVQLEFSFATVDGQANTLEGVYIDDVVVFGGCSAATPTDGGVGDASGPPVCVPKNIASTATPTASSGGSGAYGAKVLNDGVEEAGCTSSTTSKFCWISAGSTPGTKYYQYTWPSKVSIHSFLVDSNSAYRKACGSSATGRNLAGGSIQWWDGTKWVTDGTVTGKIDDWFYQFKTSVVTTKLRIYGAHASSVTGQKSNPLVIEWKVFTCP